MFSTVDEPVSDLVPWYASGPRDIDRRFKRGVRLTGALGAAFAQAYADDVCTVVREKLRIHQTGSHATITGPTLGGSIGLGLGASSEAAFVSIEAAMLYAVERTLPSAGETGLPRPTDWRSGECLRIVGADWTGVVSEHRLWTAIAYRLGYRRNDLSTLRPLAAAWYPTWVLDSLAAKISTDILYAIVDLMLRVEGRGMPDLVFWTRGVLRCYECKSSTDSVSWQQREVILSLRALPNVTCELLYASNAKHKEEVYDTD